MNKTEKMRQTYLSKIEYICDFYSCDLQPVDVDLQKQIAEYHNKEIDLTPKPGIYSEHFSNKLTDKMIVDGINKLFDEHGLFCVRQGEISRENWEAWFAMIYPEIYPYDDMDYCIGWHNKRLKKKRVDAEKIWKKI